MSNFKKLIVLAAVLSAPVLASACADATSPSAAPSLDGGTTCTETQGSTNRCS